MGSDRFGEYLKNDFQNLGDSLNGQTFAYTASTLYALFILTHTDEDARESVQAGYRGWRKTYLDIANEFGEPTYVLPGSAGIFGISLLTDNNTFQDAAFTSFEAVALSGVIVLVCKTVFGRGRPYLEKGPRYFDPFTFKKDTHSFPSGHTSTAFALTVPWIVYYPSIFTYSLLVIPVGTAFARIAKDKHWLTDVIGGAIIGGLTGYLLVKSHQETRDNLASSASENSSIPVLYLTLPF
jgi:undecaprenyl-diphosphatase